MFSKFIKGALLCCSLYACVTINIYFPEAAAQKAADRIIDQVQGEPSGEPQSLRLTQPQHLLARLAGGVLNVVIPVAHAQQANIDISSPAIRALVSSMESRFPKLAPYYQSGAVGLTADGLIEIRDRNAIPLAQRNQVNQLVAEENRDRNQLYREIAVANGHPEWQDDIQQTFAQRWIMRARSGWYYRNGAGQWVQK